MRTARRSRERARQTLARRFGFDRFRPGQEELIAAVLEGRDALGVLPTGGGKTLIFQLPAFMLDGLVVVISPLIALMEDQVNRARELGLRACRLTSQTPRIKLRRREQAISKGLMDLLFCAPERASAKGFASFLERARVALLVVDEAHCISEWGHDFRPSFRCLGDLRRRLRCQALALTATATPAVQQDILRVLAMRQPHFAATSFDRPNIFWAVERAELGSGRIDQLRARIDPSSLEDGGPATIIYAQTRRRVVRIRASLSAMGIPCEAYHAGMTGPERNRTQRRFMSGSANVIASTCAFGMGIDRSDVRAVLHDALPSTLESYYQEAGRAGRDGSPSRAIALYRPKDMRIAERIRLRSMPRPAEVLALYRRLTRLPETDLAQAKGVAPKIAAAFPAHLRWLERAGALKLASVRNEEKGGRAGGSLALMLTGASPRLGDLRFARRQARIRLAAVRRFAESRGCRRSFLLRYLGERSSRACHGCDRCLGTVRRTGCGA